MAFIALTLLFISNAWAFSPLPGKTLPCQASKLSMTQTSSPFRQIFTSAVISATLLGSDLSLSPDSLRFHPFAPTVARADFRAQQKRTYFRFSPKLITGRDYFRSEVKNAIEKEDWEVITKLFELYPSKINKDDPNQVDQYDSYVNNYLLRPMKVLSGSFAERGSSRKQKALLDQELAFEDALKDLEGCIKDRKGEGFFAGTIKAPTGKERTKQAKEAWTKGMAALDEYAQILNNGLMLELNKIPL